MSRYTFLDSQKTVSFGFDHATGYFVQVWLQGDEEECPSTDLDSAFDGLTHCCLQDVLEELGIPHNGPISAAQPHIKVPERGGYSPLEVVLSRIAMDLPI